MISPKKKSGIYNLKLPKLVSHQKSKSHLDILDTITQDLKTVGNQNSRLINNNNNNNSIHINYNKPIHFKSNGQSSHQLDEKKTNDADRYENLAEEEEANENENEFYTTSENKLKIINSYRIKPKKLPLELDKPKHNNNKQGLKSQLFLKTFLNKCKNHQNYISTIINDISRNINNNTNDILKNDPVQLGKKTILEVQSEEIDKEIFHLDYPHGINENEVSIKGPSIQCENKYLFEVKNSPMVIGEVISKMDESFAVRCKEVLESRFAFWDEDAKKKISLAKERKAIGKHIEIISGLHAQIDEQCEKMKKIKFSALKDLKTDRY